MKTTHALVFLSFLSTSVLAQGPAPEPLPEVSFPIDNPNSESKRILGKILFWDEQLSSDDTVACGTCHKMGSAGADNRTGHHPGPDSIFGTVDDIVGSPGIAFYNSDQSPQQHEDFAYGPQVTSRSAPSVLTSMYADELFWDGRAQSTFVDPLTEEVLISQGGALESQALAPILNSVEMSFVDRTWSDVTSKLNLVEPLALATAWPSDISNALSGSVNYSELFAAAFGDDDITPSRIAMAIATYERSLVPDETPWDLFTQGNQNAMTTAQKAGWELFRSSPCTGCHRPPLFSDNQFFTIGLRPVAEDRGRQNVSDDVRDRGAFRSPSLRNVGLRNNLTHLGWITGVEDALDFYNSGKQDNGHEIFTENLATLIGDGFDGTGQRINDIQFVAEDSIERSQVLDFINNALADPRVAAESFPFDKPTLASERIELSQAGITFIQDIGDSDLIQSETFSSAGTTVASLFSVNGELSTSRKFSSTDKLSVTSLLDIDDSDIGEAASVFIIAYYNGKAYTRNSDGKYRAWDGNISTLRPYMKRNSLSSSETVPITNGLKNLKGNFNIYLAYNTKSKIVTTLKPVSFEIE